MMMMPPQPVSPTSPMSIPPLSSAFRPPPMNHQPPQMMTQHGAMVAHGSMDPFGAEHPMLSISYRVPPSASALPSPGLVLPHSSLAHPLSSSNTSPHVPPYLSSSARRPSITSATPPTATPTTTTTASSADLLFAAHYQQSRAQAAGGGPAPFDPGMDYAGLYHYAPADIKHRKRTTREQLKILEETYAKDQKPNAALRKSLSETLQMTPRGVQVWFQNRRAKDKANLKKQQAIAAEEANTASSKSKLSDNENKENDTATARAASSAEPENSSSPIEPEKESPSPAKEATPSPHLQPPSLPSAAQRRGSAPNLLGSPSKLSDLPPRVLPETVVPPAKQRLAGTGLTLEQIHNVRRGSMPASVLATARQQAPHPQLQPPAMPPNVDQFGRRRSLDPTQPNLRLSQHPYASLVMNNGSMTGSPGLIGRRSSGMFLGQSLSPELNEPQRRSLLHRPSMQYGMRSAAVGEFANHQRTTSGPVNPQLAGMPSRNYPMVPRRSNLPYAFPPRVMEQPSSGPLPAPDFSFGSAVAQPVEEGEEEDLVSPATSFDSYRRFGSFASAADSDTSASQASVYSRFGSITGSEHLGMELGNLSGEVSPGQEQFRARFSGLEVKQDGPMPSTSSATMLFAARTANTARPQIKLDGATYPFAPEDYSVASTSSNPDVGLGLVTPTATQFDYPSEGVVYPSLSPSVSSASSSSSLGLPVNPASSPYDQSLAMPPPQSAHVSPADLAPLPFTFDLPQAPFPQLQDLDAQLVYNSTGFPTTNFDGSPLNMDQVPTLTTLTSEWPPQ